MFIFAGNSEIFEQFWVTCVLKFSMSADFVYKTGPQFETEISRKNPRHLSK